MSERGVFAIDRGLLEHSCFADEPFTEREAWIWMIGEAAFRPCCVRIGRHRVALECGQFTHSLRFMAQKWKWSEASVRRFIAKLKDEGMVKDANHDATITVLTICNYAEYQRVSLPSDAEKDADMTQTRRREEDTEEELVLVGDARAREADLKQDFDAWWVGYPHKVGKPPALRAYMAARKRGAERQFLIDRRDFYVRNKPPDRPWLNPATWLNQERYHDQPADVHSTNGKGNHHAADRGFGFQRNRVDRIFGEEQRTAAGSDPEPGRPPRPV